MPPPADICNYRLGTRAGRSPAPGPDPSRLLLWKGKLSPERPQELHRPEGTQVPPQCVLRPAMGFTEAGRRRAPEAPEVGRSFRSRLIPEEVEGHQAQERPLIHPVPLQGAPGPSLSRSPRTADIGARTSFVLGLPVCFGVNGSIPDNHPPWAEAPRPPRRKISRHPIRDIF